MQLALKLFTVFAIALVELWGAIPVGFALKLHPVMNCAAAILGASVGVIVVIALGDRVFVLATDKAGVQTRLCFVYDLSATAHSGKQFPGATTRRRP